VLGAALRRLRGRRFEGAPAAIACVVLPDEGEVWQHSAPQILTIARRLGIDAVDGSQVFRDAASHGQTLFPGNGDIHFNAAGHLVWAQWLHDQLQ
jgi:hypothetical protein